MSSMRHTVREPHLRTSRKRRGARTARCGGHGCHGSVDASGLAAAISGSERDARREASSKCALTAESSRDVGH